MADDWNAFPTVEQPAAPPDFSAFPAAEAPSAKITEYGPAIDPPGSQYYDRNSYRGIGDRDNQLTASPEHQSAALTQSERQAEFGTTGTSTGKPFVYQGQTYYDDDTAPEADRRIDVYRAGNFSAFPPVTQQAPKAAPTDTSNVVDVTGEAAAGTMAGEGPGTGGRPDVTGSWAAFPTVEEPEAQRPAETPTSISDAQFLDNPENVPRPQTPQGVPQKLPWEAEKGILSEPLQQAWSNLFGQGSQTAAGLDVAAAKERLAQAEAGEQKPTSLFGGGPEAKEAEELRNPNISQADAQEIIARRRERIDMDRQLAESDLSRAQTEQAKAEAATPGPEYQRTIPGTVTGFLGRAAPWLLSGTLGAAAPFAVATQMSEQSYGDAYDRSIEAGRKAHPEWNEQLNAAAHRAGTEAAQSGFENGVVMGLLPVPKVGNLVARLIEATGMRGAYMTVVQASQDIENNIAIKKNADPNQDIYDGILAHAPQNFVSGAVFGIPEGLGRAPERPAARAGEPQARPEVMPGMTTPQEPQGPPSGQRGAVVEENGEASEEPAQHEPAPEPPPNPNDFNSFEEYRAALAQHESRYGEYGGEPEASQDVLGNLASRERESDVSETDKKLNQLGLNDTPQARVIAARALRADASGQETILVPAVRTPDGQIVSSEFGHPTAAKKAGVPYAPGHGEVGYLTNTGRFVTSPMDLARQIESEKTPEAPPRPPSPLEETVERERGRGAEPPEKIVATAVKRAGIVATGVNHGDAEENLWKKLDENPPPDLKNYPSIIHGFVTNTGRFVDRYEANKIAKRANQKFAETSLGGIEGGAGVFGEEKAKPEPETEEGETFAGLGIPKKFRRGAFDIFSDITRNVYERVKGAPHAAGLAQQYKEFLNKRGEIDGKIAVAEHEYQQLKKQEPGLSKRLDAIGRYFDDTRQFPPGLSKVEQQVISRAYSGIAQDVGAEARAAGVKVRVPTSVDPSGWRDFRGAPPGPVFMRVTRPDVRAILAEPLTKVDPAKLGRPVQESDLTDSAKKLYREGQNTINQNTGKPYFQTPDDLLKHAADFKTRSRQGPTEPIKARLAPYPSFFYTYSPEALFGALHQQAHEIARVHAFGQDTGQGDAFTKTVADINADHSISDWSAKQAVAAVGDMQRDIYQLNKRGPIGRTIGGLTSVGLAAKLETSMKVLSSSLFTTGPYRGSLRTLAAIGRAAVGRGMPFDEFRRLGLASDIITNISDDPRAVTTAQKWSSNFFRGSMKLAGHLASQDIARSITAAVSKSWLTKWAIPQLLKDPTGREAVTKRLMADIRSRGMDPADFTRGPVDPKLIDRWVREDTLNLQTSYRPGSYPGWWSTPQGSFIVRFGHWSYDMSQRLVRDTLVPLARATRAGDIPLAGLYAARLTSAVAAQVAGEELIRKIKELFGQQSGVATFGEIWKAFASGNPAGAHLLMTRLGSDLIGGPVFGMFSDVGQWIYGVSTGTADTTHAFNPASPASVAYMKIMTDAVNQMAQQGGKLSSKQIERTTSSLSGMVRSWMDLAHTAGAPVPNIPALGVTGHDIEMGRRDVQFVRGRQNTFFTEHPQFDKRSKGGAFAGNARTPYLQNINDALVSGDAPEARSQMMSMQKNLGLTPKETQSTVRESVDREKPIPTGSGGIAFTTWGRVNMTPEELRRMYRIDGVYRRTAAALGVEMK